MPFGGLQLQSQLQDTVISIQSHQPAVLRNSYLWTSTCHCTYAKSRSTSKNKVQSGLLLLLLGGGHDDTKTVIKYKIDEIENLTQQDFDTLLIMIKGLRHTWILRTNISAQGVVVLIMAKQTFAATVVLILDSLQILLYTTIFSKILFCFHLL